MTQHEPGLNSWVHDRDHRKHQNIYIAYTVGSTDSLNATVQYCYDDIQQG